MRIASGEALEAPEPIQEAPAFRIGDADVVDTPVMYVLPTFYSAIFWAMNPLTIESRPPIEVTVEHRISPDRELRRDTTEETFLRRWQYYNIYTPVYGDQFDRGFWGMYLKLEHKRQDDESEGDRFDNVFPRDRVSTKAQINALFGIDERWGMVFSAGVGSLSADRSSGESIYYNGSATLGYKWNERLFTVFIAHYSSLRSFKEFEHFPVPTGALLMKPFEGFDLVLGIPTVGFDWRVDSWLRVRMHTFLPSWYDIAVVFTPKPRWEILLRYLRRNDMYLTDPDEYGADRLFAYYNAPHIEVSWRPLKWLKLSGRATYNIGEHSFVAKNERSDEAILRQDLRNAPSFGLLLKLDL